MRAKNGISINDVNFNIYTVLSWPCHKDSQNSSCRPHRCCLQLGASPSLCHLPCNARKHLRKPPQTAYTPPVSVSASDAPSHRQNRLHWWHTGPLEGNKRKLVGGRRGWKNKEQTKVRQGELPCECKGETRKWRRVWEGDNDMKMLRVPQNNQSMLAVHKSNPKWWEHWLLCVLERCRPGSTGVWLINSCNRLIKSEGETDCWRTACSAQRFSALDRGCLTL